MKIEASGIADYLEKIPKERKTAFTKLYKIIQKHIPKGISEEMSYGMIGWVVPHSTYPNGYHCDPKLPLPFLSLANQKKFIALYHMGIYADPDLLNWFTEEYKKHSKYQLDMGKSCIRFKKPDDIPLELIGELVSKMTVQHWITMYESNFTKKK